MKKVIILSVCSIWAVLVYSQDYFPIIEEGKTWNVLAVAASYPYPWDTTCSTISYQLSGDTIIDAVTYKKMYSSYEEIPANWNLYSFIREDANKKVWLKDTMAEDEYLLYDFSINEGDSLLVGNYEPVYLFVDSVTSIMVNETLRQKYWMSCKAQPDYRETWIEGIGSNKGIVWSGSAFITGGWYWLLCTTENGGSTYMNPNFNTCYFLSTSIAERESLKFNIYPNPANTWVAFDYTLPLHETQGTIEITDNLGRTIHTIDITQQQGQYVLDTRNYKAGVYYYTLKCGTLQQSGKLIVN